MKNNRPPRQDLIRTGNRIITPDGKPFNTPPPGASVKRDANTIAIETLLMAVMWYAKYQHDPNHPDSTGAMNKFRSHCRTLMIDPDFVLHVVKSSAHLILNPPDRAKR